MKILNAVSLLPFFLVVLMVSCMKPVSDDFVNEVRPSAVPLITVNPYFSIWSFSDALNGDYTRHWTGVPHPLDAFLRVDGDIYRVMGNMKVNYKVIVPTAETEPWNATYRIMPEDGIPQDGVSKTGNAAVKWYEKEYDDSDWDKGKGAFGSYDSVQTNTHWEGVTDIYIRRHVFLDSADLKKGLSLKYAFDEDIKIYINDTFALLTEAFSDGYDIIELTDRQRSYLRAGDNLIACHCLNRFDECNFDFGLVLPDESVDDENKDKELTAVQKSLNVLPTRTIYNFSCGPVDMNLTFTSSQILSDIDLVSRPVNYISYDVESNDGKKHDVQFLFTASPKIAVDFKPEKMVFESGMENGIGYAKTGTVSQRYLARKGDNLRIDWGYFYLASRNGKTAVMDPRDAYKMFESAGAVESESCYIQNENFKQSPMALVYSMNLGSVEAGTISSDYMMAAYDEVYSMQYFWNNLRPYWNRSGRETILGQIKKASDEFAVVQEKCKEFDGRMMADASRAGGRKYAELCALAYRQSIAAHSISQSPEGDILFMSKECFSNGSMGTVDVSFPSSPLYLLYNPELVKGMMNPIFYIQESGRIDKPFAVHDVGIYPQANGCQYGDGMPVEESANMLIMAYAVAKSEGNADYAAKHWKTLTSWTDYLMQYGSDPAEQLCTDDFGGHLAHNSNLAIKAILAVASYGKLAMMLGYDNIGNDYYSKAQEFAREWETKANDGDHYRLAYDRPDTWSLKYNLVWDKVLGLNIFDSKIYRAEVAYYISKQNEFGVPLDQRKKWTKSDWILWSATLSDNLQDFQNLTNKVWKFQNETTSRVPMTDFYFSDKPICVDFRARSVVGAYFIKLLEEKYSREK